MNKKNILIIVVALVLITSVGFYALGRTNDMKDNTAQGEVTPPGERNSEFPEIKLIEIGKRAPKFILENLQGDNASLEDYRGKDILINFWTTWCPFCVKEMPDLDKLYINNKDDDFVVLAINVAEKRNTAKEFVDKGGYSFPVLLDYDGEIAMTYRAMALPTTVMIDKEGIVRTIRYGAMSYAEMEELLEQTRK